MDYKLIALVIAVSVLAGCGDKKSSQQPTATVSFVGQKYVGLYKFHDSSTKVAADYLGVEPNAVGNMRIETENHQIFLESIDGMVAFTEIELLETAPCSQTKEFDPVVMLNAVGESAAKLSKQTSMTHLTTYYNHEQKLKISVSCPQDGVPISVYFSHKYYGY